MAIPAEVDLQYKLLQVRKATGLYQWEMADRLMLSRSVYANYEQRHRRITDPARLQTALVKLLREHQAHCEKLKLSIAALNCITSDANGGQ